MGSSASPRTIKKSLLRPPRRCSRRGCASAVTTSRSVVTPARSTSMTSTRCTYTISPTGPLSRLAPGPRSPFVFTSHGLRQRSRSRRLAMRYVMSRADASVALSETEAAWQQRTYPHDSDRQRVIPNGIDEAVFAYSPPIERQRGEPWRLLYVGQLSRFKGVNYPPAGDRQARSEPVDRAESRLPRQHRGATATPEAARLGLTRVHFLGAMSPVQLAKLYARSHLFVLPSTGEALPSVISEALLVGRPVVATDVGAVKEQVGSYGRIVAPGDPSALAAAIGDVLGITSTSRAIDNRQQRRKSQILGHRHARRARAPLRRGRPQRPPRTAPRELLDAPSERRCPCCPG